MPIAANQKVNEGFDYRVNQVEVPHPVTGDKSGYFMNVREDNDEILGWTTDRYGLIQNQRTFLTALTKRFLSAASTSSAT